MINTGRLWQFHAAFASGFGSLCWGIFTAWPSYTAGLYSSNSTTVLYEPMSKMDIAMLGSLPALGAMVGTVVAGPILDLFGRRNGGVILTLPYVIAWTVISASSSSKVILVARFLGGISGGGTLVLVPIMMSEVSEDSIRGTLISVSMVQNCSGTLISYLLGWVLSYKMIIWTNIGLSVAGTVLIMLVIESPVYLLRKRRDEDARMSVARYRGVAVSSIIVLDEIHKMKQLISAPTELKSITDASTKAEKTENEKLNPQELLYQEKKVMSPIKMLILSESTRRAFIVVMTVITAQIFMGMVSVMVYANTVFSEADPSKVDLYTVVFALVQIVGASVAADKNGRRILQIGGSALVAICLAGLGCQLQFRVAPPWVSVVLIMVFCFFFLLGPGSVPYILLAEVFTPEVLNLVSMLVIEWVWLMNFFIIAIFPYVNDLVGMHGSFYGFAIIGLANAIVSYCVLPETAGLSNKQIQEVFSRRTK